jgi:hypothetical protein
MASHPWKMPLQSPKQSSTLCMVKHTPLQENSTKRNPCSLADWMASDLIWTCLSLLLADLDELISITYSMEVTRTLKICPAQ